jgi:hypothetical protein
VVREIEVVLTERRVDPIRHTDQRWALNVLPNARMELGADDGGINQTGNAHFVFSMK